MDRYSSIIKAIKIGSGENRLERLLIQALRCVTVREEKDPVIHCAQNSLQELKRALENKVVTDSLLETGLQLLEDHFYLEIHEEGPSVIAFRRFIQPLREYLQREFTTKLAECSPQDYVDISDFDHSIYVGELLEKRYSPREFPAFAALDQKVNRQKREWSLKTKQGNLIVRPVSTIIELGSFIQCDSSFCFYRPTMNLAQLYLYAAHKFVRLLGVWSRSESKESSSDIPLGVVPFLLFRNNKNENIVEQNKVPWLYMEAPLLEEKIISSPILGREKETFAKALLDITATYAGLQAWNLFPVIGSTRKDKGSYSSSLAHFLEISAEQFSSEKSANRKDKVILSTVQKGPRDFMKIVYDGKASLELPEDYKLLGFLQSCGYRFPEILMNSQAFSTDKKRGQEILFGDWGPMHGTTEFVPLLNYYPVLEEKIKQGELHKI